ncbi:hypothetical protein BC831DRAFT_436905 [Entophlyctis helioformis]|nr:hypothetical protein BC831DRAFT_436905 [Entophlyctis helioformis]
MRRPSVCIAIPNCANLRAVAWDNDQGWIACGGDDGLLKVLKLESSNATNPPNAAAGAVSGPPGQGAAAGPNGAAAASAVGDAKKPEGAASAPSQLSMNQTLEGHQGTPTHAVCAVLVATWNKQHHKLTTSDSNGLIIVWILYKGMWYEEMINNRNKSVVSDMQWNKDGQKICIVYEDGAVILGSVDGNRIWGKEIKSTTLSHVQWSPDGKFLLFGTGPGELQLYDSQGSFASKVPNYCEPNGNVKIAAIDWYNGSKGYLEPYVPCLAVCYESGKVQIMRDDRDTKPVLVDTNMKSLKMRWNVNGTILAISGLQFIKNNQGEEKETCVSNFGRRMDSARFNVQFLRSLKVPGKKISSISWEYDGLRIALAVDSFIYFANIRPDYKWSFFAHDVLVFAYNKAEVADSTIVFWNTKTNDRYNRSVKKLLYITSSSDHCLIVSKAEDESQQCILTVYNAIGTPLETKYIEFEPKFAAITKTNVFVASTDILLHWQFKVLATTKMSALDAIRRKDIRDRAFHIDDISMIGSGDNSSALADLRSHASTSDPILGIAASETVLLVALQSGALYQYLVPSVTLDNKYSVPMRPQSLALNANSTRVSILDASGVLKLFDLEKKGGPLSLASGGNGNAGGAGTVAATGNQAPATAKVEGGYLLDFERKDVWDMRWASDNPEMFTIMEKTRMYIFRNVDPEDPLNCVGYICDFEGLQVKTILLDDIMKDPEGPVRDAVVPIETKALRDLRTILSQSGLTEAIQFVEDRPHARLWKIIAEYALELLDFQQAQRAFVRCQDYQGLQFIKSVQKLDDAVKQKAEIAAYCTQFESAEKTYMEMDRKDLAIDLRIRMGDWFRVVQLIKSGGGGDDILLEKAWNHIGDYYYDRQRWAQAITYYAQGRNQERLIECYYILEDYEALEKVASGLSENSPLLKNVADKFASVGLCDQAVAAFVKVGDISAAVNICVQLNQWNTAVELAEIHHYKEIEGVLSKYASHLLSQNRKWEAVELYRKANYCQKSARLLFELAKEAAATNQSVMSIKKLYVLAALEVERYHTISKSGKGAHHETATAALDGLLAEDSENMAESKFLDNAWRGAEAYHFYILAQRHLYSGNMTSAVITALHLREHEDILDAKLIYSLLALISFHDKRYNTCSKTFIKLEALPKLTDDDRQAYEKLAFSIFTKYKPVDPKGAFVTCTNCMNKIKDR